MRCVRVLRALYRSLVTVAVCSRSPLFTLNRLVSGLWFHSHRWPSVGPANVSLPIIEATVLVVVMFGLLYVVPQRPLTVCRVGQPSAVQRDRRERRHAAARVRVGEGHVPPVTGLRLDEATLVRHAAAGDRTGQVQQHLPLLVRAQRGAGAQHVLAVGRAGEPDVVVAVALVEPGALEGAAEVRRHLVHRLGPHLGGAVGAQLRDADRAVAVRDVHGVVVVDQQAGVVVAVVDPGLLGPRAVDRRRGVDVRAVELRAPVPVVGAVALAVAERGGPDALDVLAAAVQVVAVVVEVEARHRVARRTPS